MVVEFCNILINIKILYVNFRIIKNILDEYLILINTQIQIMVKILNKELIEN